MPWCSLSNSSCSIDVLPFLYGNQGITGFDRSPDWNQLHTMFFCTWPPLPWSSSQLFCVAFCNAVIIGHPTCSWNVQGICTLYLYMVIYACVCVLHGKKLNTSYYIMVHKISVHIMYVVYNDQNDDDHDHACMRSSSPITTYLPAFPRLLHDFGLFFAQAASQRIQRDMAVSVKMMNTPIYGYSKFTNIVINHQICKTLVLDKLTWLVKLHECLLLEKWVSLQTFNVS